MKILTMMILSRRSCFLMILHDMLTTAGCSHVMCVGRAYAYSPQRGVASCIHLRNSFCRTFAGGFPSTNRLVSSAEKVVKEGRSSSRVSL